MAYNYQNVKRLNSYNKRTGEKYRSDGHTYDRSNDHRRINAMRMFTNLLEALMVH